MCYIVFAVKYYFNCGKVCTFVFAHSFNDVRMCYNVLHCLCCICSIMKRCVALSKVPDWSNNKLNCQELGRRVIGGAGR